jgi:hypothetical protein
VSDQEPVSLCLTCLFSRRVLGRHGTAYLLCGNQSLGEKYPHQPVVSCVGYEAEPDANPVADNPS